MKSIQVKPNINKKNKQINISLPKKKLSKEFLSKLPNVKSIKFKIKSFEVFDDE